MRAWVLPAFPALRCAELILVGVIAGAAGFSGLVPSCPAKGFCVALSNNTVGYYSGGVWSATEGDSQAGGGQPRGGNGRHDRGAGSADTDGPADGECGRAGRRGPASPYTTEPTRYPI